MIHYFDQYLNKLREEGQLLEVSRYVDPNLEISEVTDRIRSTSGGGKALLFKDNGTNFPIVTNLFSSVHRLALAFEEPTLEVAAKNFSAFFHHLLDSSSSTLPFQKRTLAPEIAKFLPKTASSGACQEVALFPPDLNRMPILRFKPFDQAYSLGVVNLIIKNTNLPNSYFLCSGRLQWHSKTTAQIRLEPSSFAYQLLSLSTASRIPVAIILGGDPLYSILSVLPHHPAMDPYMMLSYLRRKPMVKVPCLSQPLEVPENCDIVMEGFIDKKLAPVVSVNGAEATGFYAHGTQEPLIQFTCITHRKNPILQVVMPGTGVNSSHRYYSKAFSLFTNVMMNLSSASEIKSICCPTFSTVGNFMIVCINKFYNGQSYKVAHTLWGASTTCLNKIMIVVDHDVDPFSWHSVNQALRDNYNPALDTFFSRGPLSITAFASAQEGFGGKICLDATRKQRPKKAHSPQSSACCFVHISDGDPLLKHPNSLIYVTVEEEVNLSNPLLGLWMALNQTDPIRDMRLSEGRLFIDARIKNKGIRGVSRPWCNIACSSKETIEKVDAYWDRLKIGTFVKSPSLALQPFLRTGTAIIDE